MANVMVLKTQHKEIVALVQSVAAKLQPETVQKESEAIRTALSTLAAKITIHLATEDKNLYPAMLASTDAVIKKTASDYMQEMGGLAESFKSYLAAWPNPHSIRDKAVDFCTKTQALFGALGQRIEREEKILYPLAEKM